jgi:rfaE bifunctional protein kinase chain/domain
LEKERYLVLSKLENKHILIVGDVMIDRYLRGQVSRISPEAPVPVVRYQSTENRLGGAANVALNIHALKSIPLMCSVVGTDSDGELLARLFPESGLLDEGLVFSSERMTTVKTRVLGNHQQMLRIDQEDDFDLSEQEERALLDRVKGLLDTYPVSAVILQDYNKGVLTASLIHQLMEVCKARKIPVAVDPKKKNFFAYKGAFLFKPNLKEIRDSAPFPVKAEQSSLQQAANYLKSELENTWTMITLSEQGLFLDTNTEEGGQIFPTIPRNIADVSGAGDTVISVAALGIAAGLSPAEIACLSNLAGGQVCEVPGVVPVDRALLETEWESTCRTS